MLGKPKREQTTHFSIDLKSEILKLTFNIRKGRFTTDKKSEMK